MGAVLQLPQEVDDAMNAPQAEPTKHRVTARCGPLRTVIVQQRWARGKADIHFPKLAATHAPAAGKPGTSATAPQRSDLLPLEEANTCRPEAGAHPTPPPQARGRVPSEFTTVTEPPN
jgi:hypothetical protein